jgi:hypothetical protein
VIWAQKRRSRAWQSRRDEREVGAPASASAAE